MTEEVSIPVDERPKVRLAGLIWGSAKTGKTTLACTSPGHKYIINLDPEGPVSIMHRDDCTVWDYSDVEPGEVIKVFTTTLGTKIMESPAQPGDTFVFDSTTVLNQFALLTAIKNKVGESKIFTPSLEMPGLPAYGARTQYLINIMGTVLRATKRKGCHVWFIAHEDTPEKDKEGNFLYQSILMSDNAINQASAAISEIWRMTEHDNARTIEVRQSSTHRPMGTRMFDTSDMKKFKWKYDINKPDLEQPMSIASMWAKFEARGYKKLPVPS